VILALGLGALLVAALLGVGLVYDGLSRERRRIDLAAASLADIEARHGDVHAAYAREHLDDLVARHNARLRTGAAGVVARGLKLPEHAS
jgi:hypothetical protein